MKLHGPHATRHDPGPRHNSRVSAAIGRLEALEHREVADVQRGQVEPVLERSRGDDEIDRGEPSIGGPPTAAQVTGPAGDWLVEWEPPERAEQALRPATFAALNAAQDLDACDLRRDGKLIQRLDVVESRPVSPEQID